MIYRNFHVGRFRGVKDVRIGLDRGDLALLVGLNESGKTTLLRGIEAFDHRNDPTLPDARLSFLRSVRNKSALYSNEPAVITAVISIDTRLSAADLRKGISALSGKKSAKRSLFDDFVRELNKRGEVVLRRIFPFENGNPKDPYYEFEFDHEFARESSLASLVGSRLVDSCPFIIYFEDFTDRIPEQIWTSSRSPAFNADWYDIIDGLFYNTNEQYSIKAFKKLHAKDNRRLDDAKTVMRRVNKTLNSVFTRKWHALSGVEDIESTELSAGFHGQSLYFEIKVTDTDGTTYSVDERSKGALWYLSFLMKTEFRRKKMRRGSGKPVFLIDEPASNLHSSAQENMLGDFRRLVEDTSVVYTTHSQYLVSLQNLRNTYVIRRDSGEVRAQLWAQYIREDIPRLSHYQPLANLLQLVPNSLDVPWRRAVLTEGPSDRYVLMLMHRVLRGEDPPFVIYPGTGAHNLGELISLNVGWQSEFRVLLDSDADGRESRARYMADLDLGEDTVLLLPEAGKKIEQYFTKPEKAALYGIVFGQKRDGPVKKKEFRAVMAALASTSKDDHRVASALGEGTLARFGRLIESLGLSEGSRAGDQLSG